MYTVRVGDATYTTSPAAKLEPLTLGSFAYRTICPCPPSVLGSCSLSRQSSVTGIGDEFGVLWGWDPSTVIIKSFHLVPGCTVPVSAKDVVQRPVVGISPARCCAAAWLLSGSCSVCAGCVLLSSDLARALQFSACCIASFARLSCSVALLSHPDSGAFASSTSSSQATLRLVSPASRWRCAEASVDRAALLCRASELRAASSCSASFSGLEELAFDRGSSFACHQVVGTCE